MRVVVADDSVLLREGIVRLLTEAEIEVVGQAGDADDGIQAAKVIRSELPDTSVLVLSQYAEEHYAMQLLSDGADGVGYLLKDRINDIDGFIDAVRRVERGGSALDPEVVTSMV